MRKVNLLIVLALTVSAGSARAETFEGQILAEDRDLQRRRINAASKKKMDELAAQDTACLSRFAVNDCQNLVAKQRREMLADFKRQEARINEAERRQKGVDQFKSSQDKVLDRAQRRSDMQSNLQLDMLEKKQSAQNEKVLSHQSQAKFVAPSLPVNKTASGLDAASIESNRAAFAQKQRAAAQRRINREQRMREKTENSQPLPSSP